MKKILLIIVITFCIFQMIVLAVDIDIGNAAINRESAYTYSTIVDHINPANASGKITQVEIWANISYSLTDCKVATFYIESGNNLSTRDYEYIGNVTGGEKKTFEVDLDVQEGDYIGISYPNGGKIEIDTSGGNDWHIIYEDLIPCNNQLFDTGVRIISLHGTGTTEVGWPHKWNTQSITKWNAKEFTKWNDLE
ncbi:unnamed protein product [marine sediment metagenome]|uniref:Uncharacterized protein n=1 Tax=marine sediment metagenome TaxID=412755 RepID=X1S7I1_9ZZZZ